MNEFDPNEFFVTYKEKDYSFIEWSNFLCNETDNLSEEKALEKLNEIMNGIEQKFKDWWYVRDWGNNLATIEEAVEIMNKKRDSYK